MKKILLLAFFIFTLISNAQTGTYTGSGSVTQGKGTVTTANLMPSCSSKHTTPIGTITSTDAKVWVVPTETNFLTGPYLSDLNNPCNAITPTTLAAADLTSVPTTIIDASGEVITGYIFADNYFELYINGVLIGVDPIPFTPFNSCVVKFKVSRPYTIAVKLVDWEENVGLGSEIQGTNSYHPGDGGFIAQFSDGTVTDASWKAQTFYIAPIENLTAVTELANGTRSTTAATNAPNCNGNCYGIHFEIPSSWKTTLFDDSGWPSATLYTASTVTNDLSYTRYATTAWNNASFIWSSNLILDNLVLVRKTVAALGVNDIKAENSFQITNPFSNIISFSSPNELQNATVILYDSSGKEIQKWTIPSLKAMEHSDLNIPIFIPNGIYILNIKTENVKFTTKIIHIN